MSDVDTVMAMVDSLIRKDGPWAPRWGWHDDHKHHDQVDQSQYLPAMQQVRSEFVALVTALDQADLLGGRGLQLGIGEIEASHAVWGAMFGDMVTIDWSGCIHGSARYAGADTGSVEAYNFAWRRQPYDFLFIDAGHTFDGVRADHLNYGRLVRSGGIIAFHDALKRPGYPEVEVWRYLETLGDRVQRAGDEVGTAWIIQE